MNKSAKEMFEELGYKVFDDNKYHMKGYLKKNLLMKLVI